MNKVIILKQADVPNPIRQERDYVNPRKLKTEKTNKQPIMSQNDTGYLYDEQEVSDYNDMARQIQTR